MSFFEENVPLEDRLLKIDNMSSNEIAHLQVQQELKGLYAVFGLIYTIFGILLIFGKNGLVLLTLNFQALSRSLSFILDIDQYSYTMCSIFVFFGIIMFVFSSLRTRTESLSCVFMSLFILIQIIIIGFIHCQYKYYIFIYNLRLPIGALALLFFALTMGAWAALHCIRTSLWLRKYLQSLPKKDDVLNILN